MDVEDHTSTFFQRTLETGFIHQAKCQRTHTIPRQNSTWETRQIIHSTSWSASVSHLLLMLGEVRGMTKETPNEPAISALRRRNLSGFGLCQERPHLPNQFGMFVVWPQSVQLHPSGQPALAEPSPPRALTNVLQTGTSRSHTRMLVVTRPPASQQILDTLHQKSPPGKYPSSTRCAVMAMSIE